VKTVLTVVDQVVAALEYVHRKGFVHRDVKPDKFLMDAGEQLFVIDFGLSKRYCGSRTRGHVPTRSGKALTVTARYGVSSSRGATTSRASCAGHGDRMGRDSRVALEGTGNDACVGASNGRHGTAGTGTRGAGAAWTERARCCPGRKGWSLGWSREHAACLEGGSGGGARGAAGWAG